MRRLRAVQFPSLRGRGNRSVGPCHSVAGEAAPTITSILCYSASRSVRGFELVGGFGVGVVRRIHFPGHPSARGFPLVGGFVVGGVRRIYFPGHARCSG